MSDKPDPAAVRCADKLSAQFGDFEYAGTRGTLQLQWFISRECALPEGRALAEHALTCCECRHLNTLARTYLAKLDGPARERG